LRQLIFQFFFRYNKSLVPKSRYESIQHSSAKSLTENDNNSYVGNAGSGDISVIDGDINEVIETIDVLSNPYDLEFSSFDNYVYVMN
jgi:YVTN family beta-propeller protein